MKDISVRLPLHAAMRNSSAIDVVNYLIDVSPDSIRRKSGNDELALHVESLNYCRYRVVTKLLEIHPKAINFPDFHLRLPLHVALRSKAEGTTDTIRYLINLFPDAVRMMDCENFSIYLSLHIECFTQRRYDIIIKLLEIYPEAISTWSSRYTNSTYLPLHCDLSRGRSSKNKPDVSICHLIDTYPDAARLKGEDGDLPLDMECEGRCRCRYDVIKKLIAIYPEPYRPKIIKIDIRCIKL